MVPVRVDDVLVRVSEGDDVAGEQRIILLREQDGERVLPIWVGSPEGNQLAFALHSESTFRPMTADLLAEFVQRFGGRVERVVVTRIHEKTFYATITLGIDGRTEDVDARPSDALNLAMRTSSPILVAPEVLDEAAVTTDALDQKLEQESDWAGIELPPGRWASLSAEFVRGLYPMPGR